jgi:hypothetical protein
MDRTDEKVVPTHRRLRRSTRSLTADKEVNNCQRGRWRKASDQSVSTIKIYLRPSTASS